jgi:amidase
MPALLNFLPRYFKGIQKSAETLGGEERLESRTRGIIRIGRLIPERLLTRARRNEERMAAELGKFFESVDVLLMPGLAGPPPPADPWKGRGALITFNGVAQWTPFTALWNATGQPAASVPVRLDENGLPLSVQLIGPRGDDRLLLSLAAQLEAVRPWADRRPPVS